MDAVQCDNLGSLEVTPRAIRLLAEHFKDKPKQPVRLFVKLGVCGIRMFGVALEEPRKSDHIFTVEGFQLVINRVLFNHVQPIRVDADGIAFRITGNGIHAQGGCGTCGFMCGDGKRCLGNCAACAHKCGFGARLLKKRA